jgi:hypothetical protein
MNVVIEKNIPMPPKKKREMKSDFHSLLKSMNVGDSFAVKKDSEANRAQSLAKYYGFKLTQRKLDDGTYRLWLID